MLEVISWFILFFITHLLDCIIFGHLIKQKGISKKGIGIVLLFSIIDVYVSMEYGRLAQIIVTNLNAVIIIRLLYNETMIKNIIYCIFSYLIMAGSNVIGAWMVTYLFQISQEKVLQMGKEFYLLNGITFIIFYGIMKINQVKEMIRKCMSWYKIEKMDNTVLWIIVSGVYITTIGHVLLLEEHPMKMFLNIGILFFFSLVMVSGFFKEKSDNNELQTRYEAMNEYLKAYERMLAKKSREEHEHKNQLIIIRDQVHKNNRKLLRYIEGLIEKKEQSLEYDDIKKLKNIPEGGLKGLLYYKIEKMREEKLEIYVNVSNQLSKKKIWKEMGKDLRDISMSLGVYLDNAIEAAKESKRKYIVMEIGYEEEEIVFEIANTYGEKIGKEGKSTKGIGRGQGLLLVKEIIEKNTKIREEKEMSGGYYIQRLYYRAK